MLISYPILGLAPAEVFAENGIEKISGTYPVTPGQAWHGGLHITFPATGGNEARAIADGIVVAYRIPTDKPTDAAALEKHPLNYCGWTDDGFVLLKHEKESGEKTKVAFFSLYMHLSELPKAIFKGAPGAVQKAEGIQIKRKQKIGKLGSAYGQGARMHLEVFTDDASLNAFFKRGKEKYVVDKKGCGDSDLWGDTHFVIPEEIDYFNEGPGSAPSNSSRKTTEILCITIQYRNGNRIVTAYRENGEKIGQQTEAEYKENKGYEYNLYKLAQKRFPKNISAGYELLRHGRAYGPDSLPTGAQNWQYLPLGFGRHGWIDLNQDSIKKLSDADFPYWKWKIIKEDSGVFNSNDCKCDIAELLEAIDPDQDGIAAPLELKWLYNDKEAAERLKYLICQFPSEWDATDADKKWGWLKEYFKNPAVRRKELAEKHKKWIDGVKTRSENLLKTAQSDIKLAQDEKKEKQVAAAELSKKIADLTKQEGAAEAKAKALEKEANQKKKNAKPEDIANTHKQLDDTRQALDKNKEEKQQAKNGLADAEQQIREIDVAIQMLQSKIQGLEMTLKAAPKALESADSEIKAAEIAIKNPATNTDPEKSWQEFKAHMEALQWWDKVKPLPSSTVWHFHPLAFIDHFKKCHWLNKDELGLIYKDTNEEVREEYRVALNKIMFKYGVNTPVRISHFLGQGAQESGSVDEKLAKDGKPTVKGLTSMIEASNAPYREASQVEETNGYYKDPQDIYYTHVQNYDNRNGNIEAEELRDKDGNPVVISGTKDQKYQAALTIDRTRSRAGDGMKFRGRGMKQLTGRYNYAMYWVYRGWLDRKSFSNPWWNTDEQKKRAPVINDPERISTNPYNCVDTAGWYWIAGTSTPINERIGASNEVTASSIKDVTMAINGAATEGPPSYLGRRRAATNHADSILNDKA